MKSFFKPVIMVAAIAAAIACQKEIAPADQATAPSAGLKTVTITAELAPDTKADLSDALKVEWEITDSIAVWDGFSACTFKAVQVEGSTATFTGSVAEEAKSFIAVYPYGAFSSVSAENDTVTVNIPSTQVIKAGKCADGTALVCAAKATSTEEVFAFKNACSLVKFNVSATNLKSVKITSLNDEVSEGFCGSTPILIGDKAISSTSSSLTVVAENGAFAPGTYYAAIAPVTLAKGAGFQLNFSDKKGILNAGKEMAFVRNSGIDFGDISNRAGALVVPFAIGTLDELKAFAENAGLFTYEDAVTLTADIDLKGEAWTPIARYRGNFDGCNHRIYNVVCSNTGNDVGLFSRVGDGTNPYTVKNLVVGSKDYDFAAGTGTYDGVSSYTFSTEVGNTTYYYPGTIPYVYAHGTIENVVNFVPVVIPDAEKINAFRAGALCGTCKADVKLLNCANYGDVTVGNIPTVSSGNPTIGGITGALDGADCVVDGCKNFGKVTVSCPKVNNCGGLIGYLNNACTVKNCENRGDVVCPIPVQTSYYGAFMGRSTKESTFENCKNYGNISYNGSCAQSMFIGGFVPAAGDAFATFTDCHNYGKVDVQIDDTKALYVGGFSGGLTGDGMTVSNCSNEGDVTVSGQTKEELAVAGFVARNVTNPIVVKNCTNKGNVKMEVASLTKSKPLYLGGFLAREHQAGQYENCSNSGNVENKGSYSVVSALYIGGIIAYTQAKSEATKCTNSGEIKNSGVFTAKIPIYCGGIVGYIKNNSQYVECDNSGDVVIAGTSTESNNYAGIGAYSTDGESAFIKCTNSGHIYVDGNQTGNYYMGGILGLSGNLHSITDCVNTGTISASSEKQTTAKIAVAGGIAGTCKGTITGSTNKGLVEFNNPAVGTCYLGGVHGCNNACVKMENCCNEGTVKIGNATATSYVGGLCGRVNPDTEYNGCSNVGNIEVTSETGFPVGGLFGKYSARKASTGPVALDCSVNCKMTLSEACLPLSGIVLGSVVEGTEMPITIGSTESPVKVAGTFGTTVLSAGNFQTVLSAPLTIDVINAIFEAGASSGTSATVDGFGETSEYTW